MSNQMQALGVIIAVLGVAGAVVFFHQQQASHSSTHQNNAPSSAIQETQISPSLLQESDQVVLEEELSYIVGGDHRNSMKVMIEVENDIITKVTVKHTASSLKSEHHQNEFDSAYHDQVVGKPISEVKVERVAGSTITTDTFNKAIANMREQL